ncbi:uncharacterized protein [Cicer arietinum]|uniref:Uncharacterized protein LOC101508358 isoform X9 n=1 Tax=Cicer arietinum TaxID=3827 RepID=A0A3Q7XS94_CICAR|nr:uncharacterized protein LOC101508358 isoform X9 [Cicer arietinum]
MDNSKSYMLLCIGLFVILCSQVLAYNDPVPPICDGELYYHKDLVYEKIPIIDGPPDVQNDNDSPTDETPAFQNDQYSNDSPKTDAVSDNYHYTPYHYDFPSERPPLFNNIQESNDFPTTDAISDFYHDTPYHYEFPSDRTPYFNNIQDSNDSPKTDETPAFKNDQYSNDSPTTDAVPDVDHNNPYYYYEFPFEVAPPLFSNIQETNDSPTTDEAPDFQKIQYSTDTSTIDGPIIEDETVTTKKNDITTSESEKGEANKEANWVYLHAKYPWMKKNVPKSTTGTRKLLNDVANN